MSRLIVQLLFFYSLFLSSLCITLRFEGSLENNNNNNHNYNNNHYYHDNDNDDDDDDDDRDNNNNNHNYNNNNNNNNNNIDTTTKPKAFIHIGIHKTGSTSIQTAIRKLGKLIRDQGYIPEANRNFFKDIKRILSKNNFSIPLGDFIYNGKKNYIISDERFDQLSGILVARLGKLFEKYDVKIVVYVRNPYDLVHSYWLEMSCIGQGYTRHQTFPEFLATETTKTLKNQTKKHSGIELWTMLNDYIRVFGKNNIILVDFDGVLERKKSLPGVFLSEIVGLEGIEDLSNIQHNKKASLSIPFNLWASSNRLHHPPCQGNRFGNGEIQRLIEEGLTKPCDESDFDQSERILNKHFEENLKKSGLKVMYPMRKKKKRKQYGCLVLVNKSISFKYFVTGEKKKQN